MRFVGCNNNFSQHGTTCLRTRGRDNSTRKNLGILPWLRHVLPSANTQPVPCSSVAGSAATRRSHHGAANMSPHARQPSTTVQGLTTPATGGCGVLMQFLQTLDSLHRKWQRALVQLPAPTVTNHVKHAWNSEAMGLCGDIQEQRSFHFIADFGSFFRASSTHG